MIRAVEVERRSGKRRNGGSGVNDKVPAAALGLQASAVITPSAVAVECWEESVGMGEGEEEEEDEEERGGGEDADE